MIIVQIEKSNLLQFIHSYFYCIISDCFIDLCSSITISSSSSIESKSRRRSRSRDRDLMDDVEGNYELITKR